MDALGNEEVSEEAWVVLLGVLLARGKGFVSPALSTPIGAAATPDGGANRADTPGSTAKTPTQRTVGRWSAAAIRANPGIPVGKSSLIIVSLRRTSDLFQSAL